MSRGSSNGRPMRRVRPSCRTRAGSRLYCGLPGDGTLLPRSLARSAENIATSWSWNTRPNHRLWRADLYGPHLAEIRSITVDPRTSSGGGKRLVKALLSQAEKHSVTCVCLFTRIPEFFSAHGIYHRFTSRTFLQDPQGLHKCPRLTTATKSDDTRDVPRFAILPAPNNWLKIEA